MPVLETTDAGAAVADPMQDAQQAMQGMLDRAMAENPRLRLIAEMMRNQSEAQEARQEQQARRATAASQLERMRARYEELREAYGWLQERNEQLACALGACPRCWGEDASCGVCRGRGEPGAHAIDRAMFAHYVLPAVRRRRRALPGAATHPATHPAKHPATHQEE